MSELKPIIAHIKSGKIIIERKIPQMISHWVFWTTQGGFDILSYIDKTFYLFGGKSLFNNKF